MESRSSGRGGGSSSSARSGPDLYSYNPRSYDREPVLYKIYRGRVSKLMDFGAFVRLDGLAEDCRNGEGLVHRDQLTPAEGMRDSGSSNVRDLVRSGQTVFVKVLAVTSARLSLTMKEADQRTGRDLNPARQERASAMQRQADDARSNNPSATQRDWAKELGIVVPPAETLEQAKGRARKRLSSPERWEAKQLEMSGVLPPQELPQYDDEFGLLPADDGVEQELDIELNDEEPAFLEGQSTQRLQLSPVKIVKNPNGTLQRAAMTQQALAKERREITQAKNSALDNAPKDLHRPWEDPMPGTKKE